ncbi:hypothetical protein MMC12_001679 [Toensbergia leucococca]|nr:hypothetical protein [Toensbergia leucococca]
MEQDVVLVYWHEGTSLYEDLAPVLLRSFLGQVIQQRRHMQYNAQFQYLLASIESKPVSISSFLFRHLLRTLLRSLASSDRIFLMIDGLDDGDWVKKQILDVIFESMVQEKRKPQIKCMVSSRAACSQPHNLKKVWELNLDMGEPARRDILIHITGSIKKLSFEFPGCGAVLESIGTEILQRSRGNFLLALLTMEETRLVLSSSRGINHALIDDWPWDISAIYLKMLQSIHSQDILIAKQVFTWLTHAMKPLHISELMEALITGPPANVPAPELFFQRNSTRTYSSEDLINICGGLVTIKSDQTVRFIHHSVREYLLVWHRGKFPHKFYVEISQAHEYLAQICLQHLFDQKNMHFPVPDLHGHWPRVKTPGEKYRFLDYASTYWCEHYRFSETHSTYLPGMLYYCLQKKAWEVETGCPNSPSATSPLYAFIRTFRACTQMGFAAMGQIYLEMGVEVNEIYCSHQGTPLHIAVANGHLDIARLLIKNGACVNAATPELGKTPLHLACSQGDLEMCKFLLENGADKDATTEQYAETSLHLAVVEGHLHVVEHLVETGANINMAVSPTNETPLHLAAAHGRIEECLILLSGITKGRLPDSSFRNKVRDCSRASPMLFEKTQYISYDVFTKYRSAGKRWEVRKATSGSFDSVKMLDIALTPSLPRSWADVEARTQDGWTALHVAAAYGHEMICELLLDSGADFRALTFLGRTALELTIANGHSALASSLVLLWTEAPFDADARLDRSLLAAANSCDRGISRLPNSLKSHYEGSFTNHISRSGQRSPHSGDSEKVDDYSTIFYQPSDSPEELQDQEEWTMLNFSKLMT